LGLGKGKRRKEPRFWVQCFPEYEGGAAAGALRQIVVDIRNDSDVAHSVDEALIRYDDGRIGAQLPLAVQLAQAIPAHSAVRFTVPATLLLDPGSAIRFRVVIFRGKSGQRKEWSSKEERLNPAP
jgi:hypothetical protein